jgi:hypothetical protein
MWDISRYESAEAIAAALRRAGHMFDDELIVFYATHTLLLDVVDAAGGVKRSHEQLHQAIARVQETYAQWRSQSPERHYWQIVVKLDDGQTYYVNIGLR